MIRQFPDSRKYSLDEGRPQSRNSFLAEAENVIA
jgi:hypothetical protein